MLFNFYKQTSLFTDLGFYKTFAQNLTNDINELCILQRKQMIHPVAYFDKDIRLKQDTFWGDMTKVHPSRLDFEEEQCTGCTS